MHERTSRAIARLLFLFCCAVPTLLVVGMILLTWTPWYHGRVHRNLEQTLLTRTGLRIQFDSLYQGKPDVWQLTKVRLRDQETDREVGKIREVVRSEDGDEFVLMLRSPELQSSELSSVWKLFHDRYLCAPEQLSPKGNRIIASDLTVHGGLSSLTFTDVQARVQQTGKIVEASVHFRTANQSPSDPPIQVGVRRDRSQVPPLTRWTLQTGPTALPCSVLADYLPIMGRFGEEARYRGTLKWEQTPSGYRVDLSGSRFTQIDLSRLMEGLPRRMTGQRVTLSLARCRLNQQGKCDSASGHFTALSGTMDRSLLASLSEHLRLTVLPGLVPPNLATQVQGEVAYDALSVHFAIAGETLTLTGNVSQLESYAGSGISPRAIVVAGGMTVVGQPDQRLPTIRLAGAIAPAHSARVPLSRQTSPLLNFLPSPSRPPTRFAEPEARVTRLVDADPAAGTPIKQR
ncbi:MAG: hypothetical protein AAGA03_05740 [Planctomycetota bacterium]